ncbi:RpiB/LacA/LacB family sugar-phosphate isomerase [Novosphingobium colocasiae]
MPRRAGVRAALGRTCARAQQCQCDRDGGARLTGIDMAKACIDAFLGNEFGGGRHGPRVDKLSNPAF